MSSIEDTYLLNDGNRIPVLGLGCWAMDEDQTYNAVLWAIQAGYRLIDTASVYHNETAVGKALKDCGLSRNEYYVVTKLHPETHGYESTKTSLRESLEKLQLEYVDLFLIHSPKKGRNIESWKAMIELKNHGKTKSIGVSNFSNEHIEGLLQSGLAVPAVNQIEIHPANRQKKTVEYCKKKNIVLMNYCPLARGRIFAPGTLPIFDKLEIELKKTKAQLFLKWAIQSGFVTIPKSSNAQRIKENANLFGWSISSEYMTLIGQAEDNKQTSKASAVMLEPWSSLEK